MPDSLMNSPFMADTLNTTIDDISQELNMSQEDATQMVNFFKEMFSFMAKCDSMPTKNKERDEARK